MNLKCLFRYDDGSYCKRWAQKGSRFCYNHQPQGLDGPGGTDWPSLHPFTRLATLSDLFDLLRESLNAARMGTMPTGQAASICSLATLWLKTYEKMEQSDRLYALTHQILPTLVDAESAAHAERLAAATAETERAAAFAAELDHIAAYGPPGPLAQLEEQTDTPGGHGFRDVCVPDGSAGSHANKDGAPAPSFLPEADAESAAVGRTQHHSDHDNMDQPHASAAETPPQPPDAPHHAVPPTPPPNSEPPRRPVNLREAQAKLEAMLAEQRTAKSPANPNGS